MGSWSKAQAAPQDVSPNGVNPSNRQWYIEGLKTPKIGEGHRYTQMYIQCVQKEGKDTTATGGGVLQGRGGRGKEKLTSK